MKATRRYYAVNYLNGVAVCARTGNRYLAHYHSFESRFERDEWIKGGGDFRTSRNWRESILASDKEVRVALSGANSGDPYKDHVIFH